MALLVTCAFEGCDKPAFCRGWCSKHYARWQRHGDPSVSLRGERGAAHSDGRYLRRTVNGKRVREHRRVWQEHHGPIPPGQDVHHEDGIKTDNQISNLELLPLRRHRRVHALASRFWEHSPCWQKGHADA